MRRHIRLTGRKQLPASAFDVDLHTRDDNQFVSLSVANKEILEKFPADAHIKLKLSENKVIRVLGFGSVTQTEQFIKLEAPIYSAPSCQLRIVSSRPENLGLLLGSTKSWTVGSASGAEGILLYDTTDLGQLLWRLDIRDAEYPVLYLNKKIRGARNWVNSDPVFLGGVLPAVIQLIFLDILQQASRPEVDWMASWLDWANKLMPGAEPPFGEDHSSKQEWIQRLLDSFGQKFHLADRIVKQLETAA